MQKLGKLEDYLIRSTPRWDERNLKAPDPKQIVIATVYGLGEVRSERTSFKADLKAVF